MKDTDPYNLHWPFRRGKLNLHAGPGGTLTAVLQDIHDIWSYAIQNFLDIPIKDLKVCGKQLNYPTSVISGTIPDR